MRNYSDGSMTHKLNFKLLLIAVVACLFGTASLFAQSDLAANPQVFAGVWRFDPKSSSSSQPSAISERNGDVLKITVKEPLLRIVQVSILGSDGVKIGGQPLTKGSKRSSVIDLYMDKRGETNAPQPFNPEHMEASQTYWKDGILFREWNTGMPKPGTVEYKFVHTYKVSKDGKTLFIETVSPEGGATPVKYVYKKCADEAC